MEFYHRELDKNLEILELKCVETLHHFFVVLFAFLHILIYVLSTFNLFILQCVLYDELSVIYLDKLCTEFWAEENALMNISSKTVEVILQMDVNSLF